MTIQLQWNSSVAQAENRAGKRVVKYTKAGVTKGEGKCNGNNYLDGRVRR
jgi:hypothetical protein